MNITGALAGLAVPVVFASAAALLSMHQTGEIADSRQTIGQYEMTVKDRDRALEEQQSAYLALEAQRERDVWALTQRADSAEITANQAHQAAATVRQELESANEQLAELQEWARQPVPDDVGRLSNAALGSEN